MLLVIYPVGSVYRVSVESRLGSGGSFGPLFDGALVSERALAPLVRATAVNAGRAKRRAATDWKRCDEHRADVIAHLLAANRHPTPSYAHLLQQLLPTSNRLT